MSDEAPTIVRRDWTDARAKVDSEGRCRVCSRAAGGRGPGGAALGVVLEAAHVVGREHDVPRHEAKGMVSWTADDEVLWVAPVDVVPLCRTCHALYDRRGLDLLPYLTVPEQAAAVLRAGGILRALRRVSGGSAAVVDVPPSVG